MKKHSTGNPLATLLYIFLFCTVSMLIITACRKTDRLSNGAEKEKINSEKFFKAHQSANSVIIAAQQFVKNQNDRYHFVENIIRKIGLPYWDKSLVFPNRNTVNSISTESVGDSNTVVYIPFVAESGNDVKTSLVINMSPSDTVFKFIYDRQYHDTTINGGDRLKLPLILMSLSNSVFGNRVFKIMDSTAFPVTGGRADYVKLDPISTANRTGITTETIWEYTLTLCYTWWEFDPWVVGCEPGGPCNPGRNVSACHTIQWQYDDGMGSGGNGGGGNNGGGGGGGGGGGNGSGGNWEPEQECLEDQNTEYIECPVPWGPDPNPPPPLANQRIIDSLMGYPCAQIILAQMPSCNSEVSRILDSIFNVNEDVNLFFRADTTLTKDSLTNGYAIPLFSGTTGHDQAIYFNSWMLKNASREYIASTMLHESIHSYIDYWFGRYLVGQLDSSQFKLMFPIFWNYRRPLSAQELGQHNEMANNYVGIISRFVKNYNPAISDSMATALAWKGLQGTTAWQNRSDTNQIINLQRIARRDLDTTSYILHSLSKCN